LFANISPATISTAEGTIWLAFLSNRLQLTRINNTSGYRIWLTSTRDGRQWSRLRPVSVEGVGGWPPSGGHMLQTPDGKCRIFWSKYAGQAQSFADITHLRPIDVELGGDGPRDMSNPYVIADEQGLLHMAFNPFLTGIYHTTSDDGQVWAAPTALVSPDKRRRASNPQLLMSDGKATLFYEENGSAFLAPIRFTDNDARIGDPIKITNHVIPLSGSRITVTRDGEVLLLAGSQTTWLLRANQEALFALDHPKQ